MGGWIASVGALQRSLGIMDWQPYPGMTTRDCKSSLQKYRREVVTPAIMNAAGVAANPQLPWHWLTAVGSCQFREAFEAWWQLRVLGHMVLARQCPGCTETDLTSVHLEFHCARWASLCFWCGALPCGFFGYPDVEKTVVGKLQLMGELLPRMDAAQGTRDNGAM